MTSGVGAPPSALGVTVPLLQRALHGLPIGRIVALIENSGPDDQRVAVSREDFGAKIRGRSFERWRDFKEALGPDARLEPEVGGEERLMSGLSIAFAIILNVLVWAVVAYSVKVLVDRSPRLAAWAVFLILSVYGLCVNAYCQYAYSDPRQRLITNFLFGLVPLAVSSASYVLAVMVLDMLRGVSSAEGFEKSPFERLNPWVERCDGRLIFFLAVLPGLFTSIHLANTVSTGFEAAATHFDILSLCLFIDVGRFVGHLSYLVAREWSIGKSPDSISSRPGLCYVFHALCFAWYLDLARLEAGKPGLLLADRTKSYTLACLTSFVFFPLSLYLLLMNMWEFFDMMEERHETLRTCCLLMLVFVLAVFMLAVAVVFDAIEPNLMGIGALLWAVFYGAFKLSHGSLLRFILAMIPLAILSFGVVILSASYAESVREALFHALRSW